MQPSPRRDSALPGHLIGRLGALPTCLFAGQAVRLLAILATTNLAFWLLWPAGIVAVEGLGWGPVATGLFGSMAWIACLAGLGAAPRALCRIGARRTTMLAAGLMLAAALGMVVVPAGTLAWLWTSLLGLALGLRWTAVDSWLADGTPAEAKGRALALSETLAGATFMAGPALAASLSSIALTAWAAALCAGTGILLTYATSAPRRDGGRSPPGGTGRIKSFAAVAPVILVAALWGGLFESGFSAAASLLALVEDESGSGSRALWAAAATGAGSFAAQYGLGILSDRRGARPVLLGLSAVLTISLTALVFLPTALVPMAALVGASGGGLYTVAVVAAVQAQRGGDGSAGAISSMALLYTLGTMAAPALSGGAIAAAGTGGLLAAMAMASAALVAGLRAARGWV